MRGANSICKVLYCPSEDDIRSSPHVSQKRGMITKYKPAKHLGLPRGARGWYHGHAWGKLDMQSVVCLL